MKITAFAVGFPEHGQHVILNLGAAKLRPCSRPNGSSDRVRVPPDLNMTVIEISKIASIFHQNKILENRLTICWLPRGDPIRAYCRSRRFGGAPTRDGCATVHGFLSAAFRGQEDAPGKDKEVVDKKRRSHAHTHTRKPSREERGSIRKATMLRETR